MSLLAGVTLLGATGWVLARRSCGGRFAETVLAAWLYAYAVVVALSLFLGALGFLTRAGMLISLGVSFVAVAAAGRLGPAPSLAGREALAKLRDALHDPLVAAMSLVAVLGLGYAVALGVGTPPNDWDSVIYHLPRAALWLQQGQVGYVEGTADERIDVAAPHAEIGVLVTMLLSRGDRWMSLVQVTSLLALGTTVFAFSRRVGLDVRQALFGALVFLCLPLLLLQAGTALNDIVVASFLAASVLFALTPGRSGLVLSALGLALAAGTKPTTFIALPAAIVVVLSLLPRTRWLGVAVSWVAGLTVGSYWYFLNLAQTGRFDGGLAEIFQQVPDRQPAAVLLRVYQLSVNLLEMPATAGRGRWLYYALGVVFISAALVVAARGRRRTPLVLVGLGVFIAVVPWLLHRGQYAFQRPPRWLLDSFGYQDLASGVSGPLLFGHANPFTATFGAVAVILVVATVPLGLSAVRRHQLPRGALTLIAAPALVLVSFALAVTFDEMRSRFLIFPVALAAVLWGLALPRRLLAMGVVALSAASVFTTLAFATWKPSGLALLFDKSTTRTDSGSVWTEPRWRMQGGGRQIDPDANRFVTEHVPPTAEIGLVMGRDHSLYAFFNGLKRPIHLVAEGASPPARVPWLVVSADRSAEVPGLVERGWLIAVQTPKGWSVHHRPVSES